MGEQKRSLILGFGQIAGSTFITLLIGLFTTPIITRIVDPIVYGNLSLFTMYANIAMLVFSLGLEQSLLRFYYKRDDIQYKRYITRRTTMPSVIIACFVGIISLTICGMMFSDFLSSSGISITIVVLFWVQILGSLVSRYATMLLRLEYKNKEYAYMNILSKLLYVISAMILIKAFGKDYFLCLVAATVLSTVTVAIVTVWIERNIWFGEIVNDIETTSYSEIVKYGIPFIFIYGITMLLQSLDKMSLSYYCSANEVGVYSSAMNLIHIFAIIQTSFNVLWHPVAVKHYEDNPNDRSLYVKVNEIITVVMAILGCGLILFKDVFVLLLGEQYRLAAKILPFLVFNPIMLTISETTVLGITFKKKSNYNIVVSAVACFCNFIGNTLFVPLMGGQGAAISTGLSYIVYFYLRTFFANRCIKIPYKIKKVTILILLLLVYAFYNTFYSSLVFNIIGFLFLISVILIMYKKTVAYIIGYILRISGNIINTLK